MAERPELLGLATNIVPAHVSHNAVTADQLPGADPAGLQRTGYRRTGCYCATEDRTRCGGETFNLRRSRCLFGMRQKSHDAEAAFDDGSQNDAGAVSAALAVAILISNGGTRLCEDTICSGEEVWAWSQRVSHTEEGRTKNCPDGATAAMSSGIAGRASAGSRELEPDAATASATLSDRLENHRDDDAGAGLGRPRSVRPSRNTS